MQQRVLCTSYKSHKQAPWLRLLAVAASLRRCHAAHHVTLLSKALHRTNSPTVQAVPDGSVRHVDVLRHSCDRNPIGNVSRVNSAAIAKRYHIVAPLLTTWRYVLLFGALAFALTHVSSTTLVDCRHQVMYTHIMYTHIMYAID